MSLARRPVCDKPTHGTGAVPARHGIYLAFLAVLLILFAFAACSVDPLSPQGLEGTWLLLVLTDEIQGFTLRPGESIEREGVRLELTGGLFTFQKRDERNEFVRRIIFTRTVPSTPSQFEEEVLYGRYTLADSSLTLIDAETGTALETVVTRSGFRLRVREEKRVTLWGKL